MNWRLHEYNFFANAGYFTVTIWFGFMMTSSGQVRATEFKGDGHSELVHQESLKRPAADEELPDNAKIHHFTPETFTVVHLQKIRNGDTVNLSSGTYRFDDALITAFLGNKDSRKHVTFRGAPHGETILELSQSAAPRILYFATHSVGTTLDRLSFRNLAIRFHDSTDMAVINCRFSHYSAPVHSAQNANSNAVYILGGTANKVENNIIDLGTKAVETKGIKAAYGNSHLICGNEVSGHIRGGIDCCNGPKMRVTNNIIIRTANIGSQDHGIYIHDLSDINISFNSVSGFLERGDGGSLKLKNVDHAHAHHNDFHDSGIMMRVETGVPNARIKNVWLEQNRLTGGGINCWTPGVHQEAIRIEKNLVLTGNISASSGATPSTFNMPVKVANDKAGGVYNNFALKGISLVKGVLAAGNSSSLPPALSAPDDQFTTPKGQAILIENLPSNKARLNNGNIQILTFCQPSNGTLKHKGKGSFIYTPYSDFEGTDSFAYIMTGNNGAFNLARVILNVGTTIAASPRRPG